MGTALANFQNEHPDDFDYLKVLAKDWPFLKYSLIQIESNLLNSDSEVMHAFADLVDNKDVQKELMDLIMNDYQTGLDKIEDVMEASVESRRRSKLENNRLRDNALHILHKIQIDNLIKWRSIRDSNPVQGELHLLQLLLLVNALSGGLKNTG